MVPLTRPLFAVLLLAIAAPLAAQRGSQGAPSAPSRSSPSGGGSSSGFSRSAPAPSRPSYSSPAPSRPSYQSPAPSSRPSYSSPAPSARPSPQNPAPSQRPTYQAPRPTAPAPSAPTSRPTTPSFGANRPATSPSNTPSSRPSGSWGSAPVGSSSGGTISRPVGGTTRPAGGTVARPTTGANAPGAAANRYRPTQPDAAASKPIVREPGAGRTPTTPRLPGAGTTTAPTKPLTREPGAVASKPGLSPRRPQPSAGERPATKPLLGDRYGAGARPTAAKPLAGDRPTVADKPLRGAKPVAARTPSDTVARPARPAARPATTVAALAPRLGAPRPTSAARVPNRAAFHAASDRYAYGAHVYGANYGRYDCHRALWCDYWNPWPRTCWWGGPSWTIGWYGGGCFNWSFSLGYPYWYCRTSYWYGCYGDAFWCGWSQPYYPASCYWWYPSTVYCPTYLYVPSAVYVPSTVYVTQTVVSEPPAEAAPAPRVVVAGGPSDRVVVRHAGAGAEATNRGMAQKYVELGDFYFREHRFRDAAEAYGKARAQVPDDASVHLVLADAVFADGDYHYAAFLVGEALRLDPTIASAATDKRSFYGDAKVFDAQMQALDAYLERAPYDAQAHFVKGYNLHFSARRDDAKKAFQRVLEIEPGHRGAEAFLTAAAPVAAPAAEPSEIR